MPHQSGPQAAPFWSQKAVVFGFGEQIGTTFWSVCCKVARLGGYMAPELFTKGFEAVHTACRPVLVFLPLSHSLQSAVFEAPSRIMAMVTAFPSFFVVSPI